MSEPVDPDNVSVWSRETAPQSPITTGQVGMGIAVLVVGALIAFGIPLALA